jgi:hypothetical protein
VTRYYLGIVVHAEAQIVDGWQWAIWPDGRRFKHWADQLKETPWGEVA